MACADRAQWFAARTLPGLANLTARWLERDLASQPGYDESGRGPDPETLELAPTLVLLNRAGWLTDCSQPGYVTADDAQRAACTGFADRRLADRVARTAQDAGLLTFAAPVDRRWWARRHRRRAGVAVSREHGAPVTWFGCRAHRRDLELRYGGWCRPEAVAAVVASTNLTVVDPVWGRNDVLWPVLREVVSA
jgi:hypothetical protein